MTLRQLPTPFFVLAPMDDVTDTVFRQIVADCARPDLFFTEFVNVDGLQSPGRGKLLHKLSFADKETPIIAQLWGLKPDNFYKTAKEVAKMGFAGIDLNMGCPVKTVIKNGACAALMNNRELAPEIIAATKKGAKGLPVSVKTRLGFSETDFSWLEFLLKQKLDMLTIHLRTVKQMSKTPANWEQLDKIRELRDKLSPKTLLVGNGDVQNRVQAEELAAEYQLDGVMIGRATLHDPFVFSTDSSWPDSGKTEKLDLFTKHIKLYLSSYPNGERKFEPLRKFCKLYINGFDGASELREAFMRTASPDEALELLSNH